MAGRNFRRAPRWTSTGYWVDRNEDDQRQGDRSRARTYDQNDMRRYASRSQEQGQRLRSLRGSGRDENVRYPDGSEVSRGDADSRRGYRETGAYQGNRDARRQGDRSDFDFPYDMDDRPGSDRAGNYYGEREMRRQHGSDYIEGGFISARGSDRAEQTEEDRRRYGEYDMDPGYAYEFGTRYDISNQFRPETYERGSRNRPPQRRGPWNVPGPYSGVGPQNYRRSDERITDEIYGLFTRSGAIDARRIDVEVRDGMVNLRGNVERKHEKRLAEDMAASITGVREVNNYIQARRK